MSSKVVLGRKYSNISKFLNNDKLICTNNSSEIPMNKILRDNTRKQPISNNDRLDQIKKEIAINYSK